jgi:DNA-binding response OmpR family regulator
MPGLIQRLLTRPPESEITESLENNRCPRVLAVTADLAFYSGILNAASSAHWHAEWARSLNRAVEICSSKSMPIVVFDANLPDIDWAWAFERLAAIPNAPRLVLAAPSVDEDLWRNVLQRHGYDVVKRSASSDELRRLFRFAWLSMCTAAES